MRTEISKLHRRLEATIIYVTHDQVEAMTMASRIFIMNDGRLQQSGSPLNVYKEPANKFVAGFIGSPAMNFLDATLIKEGTDYLIDAGSFKVKTVENIHTKIKEYIGGKNLTENSKAKTNKNSHPKLKEYIGKKVIFGVRPEDLYNKKYITKDIPGNALKAKVEVIEPLGAEIFIYLDIGKHSLVGKMDSQTQVKVEENMEVVIDMEKTHIFDPETMLTII